jgi:serine/threonine protein kinase
VPVQRAVLADIVFKVALALQHIHLCRVVHFDLKLSNVLVSCDNLANIMVKIADMGISRYVRGPLLGFSVRFDRPKGGPPASSCALLLPCSLGASIRSCVARGRLSQSPFAPSLAVRCSSATGAA